MDKVKAFFHGVKKEIERVRWPNRKSMIKYSVAVLSLCAFMGIFFYMINIVIVLIREVFK